MVDTHTPMFDGNLIAMNIDRRNILFWMKFYNQNVFSLDEKDRPDDFTINYDILLDTWLEKKHFDETVHTPNRQRTSAKDMDSVIEFG